MWHISVYTAIYLFAFQKRVSHVQTLSCERTAEHQNINNSSDDDDGDDDDDDDDKNNQNNNNK